MPYRASIHALAATRGLQRQPSTDGSRALKGTGRPGIVPRTFATRCTSFHDGYGRKAMVPIRSTVRNVRPPLVTVLLLAVNAAVFFWEVGLHPLTLETAVRRLGLVPVRQTVALREAPWLWEAWLLPLLTSMFLHGGWAHFAGNMLHLWVFGSPVENRLGHGRYLIFYLLSGLAAGQAQVWVHPDSPVPMIGASGAIAGVLGAYLVLYPFSSIVMMVPLLLVPLFFEVPALLFLLVWFLQQIAAGTVMTLSGASQGAGVAWWAHVGGFLAGLLLLPVLLDRRHHGHRPPSYRQASRWQLPY